MECSEVFGIDADIPIDLDIINRHNEKHEQMHNDFLSGNYTIDNPFVVLNPYGMTPLSAQAGIKTEIPSTIVIKVVGKNGPLSDLVYSFGDGKYHTEHFFPILGLYPDHDNKIIIGATDDTGKYTEKIIEIRTDSLPDDFGKIEVIVPAHGNLTSNQFYFTSVNDSYSTAVDYYGNVRWYIHKKYTSHITAQTIILNNGHLLTKGSTQRSLIEFDQLGRVYRVLQYDFIIHHEILQLENNDLVVQSGEIGKDTILDTLSYINFETGEATKIIDYKEVLDKTRHTKLGNEKNWLHANSIDYNKERNELITSSRHQNAVIATDKETNKIKWILGPLANWGCEYREHLLMPIDKNGELIYTGSAEGAKNIARNFWNWGQHSAKVFPYTKNENTIDIILFDNGCYRSYFEEDWIKPYENWSRAVRYRINLVDRTVQIIWQYGRELGQDYYCGFVGSVQYINSTNSLVINFGGTNIAVNTNRNVGIVGDVPMSDFPEESYSTEPILGKTKVQEVNMDTNEVLFEFHQYNPELLHVCDNCNFNTFKASLYTSSIYPHN